MGAAHTIADVLQTYGGWGVSTVMMITVWIMARHIMKMNKERLDDHKAYNEEMLSIVEKRVETDLKHAEAFRSLREVVSRLVDKL
jgi:hypothetical protein